MVHSNSCNHEVEYLTTSKRLIAVCEGDQQFHRFQFQEFDSMRMQAI